MTEGFDVGLEMSGSQAGLHDMIHNMKHGGNIALSFLELLCALNHFYAFLIIDMRPVQNDFS